VQLELWPFAYFVLVNWRSTESELRDTESAIALPVGQAGKKGKQLVIAWQISGRNERP
jgi:hypothetical protein